MRLRRPLATYAEYMAAPPRRARRDYVRALRHGDTKVHAMVLMAVLAARGDMRRAEKLRRMYAPGTPGYYPPPEGGDATPH